MDISFGIALTTWTDEDYIDGALNPVSEPAGNMDFGVNFRYWMDPMGKYVLVPHGAFWYSKQGVDWYGFDAGDWTITMSDENKYMMFDLGLGMNYEAMADVLVVGDFGFMMEKEEWTRDYTDTAIDPEEWKDGFMVLPYFKLGIDAEIFKWLDLRSGVATYWEGETYEPSTDMKRKYSSAFTDTYLGAGFNWGNFYIDAEINTDFIENGPYFISGEYDYLTENVTIKYMF
jgi:hypothetical protein